MTGTNGDPRIANDDRVADGECAETAANTRLTELCATVAAGLLQRAAITPGCGERRLPDRERVGEAITVYRKLLFPEVWTEGDRPDRAALASKAEWLHCLLKDLLYAEAMARPDRDGQRPLDGGSERAKNAAMTMARACAEKIVAALPHVRAAMEEDLEAFVRGDPAARSRAEIILCYPGFHAIETYRLAHLVWGCGGLLVARMMTEQAHAKTGIDLHPGASIAPAFFIDHGTGVVVGETAVIGRRVRLYQGVTIGARSIPKIADRPTGKRHPTLHDDVIVYANATILGGDTEIGRGAIVGGNAWITTSVPPGSKLKIDVAPRVADTVVAVPDGAQPD